MNVTIDTIDRKILKTLQSDGRISLAHLSEKIGLSATPCKRRLMLLEDSGVIAGYEARINHKACGFGLTALISVELERQDSEELLRFQREISKFEEIVTGTLLTGSQDFMLEIVVESLEEYESFLQTKLLRVSGIRAVRSRFALRRFINRSRIP